MIGEIAAVIGLVKGLNDAIATLKEAGNNAGGFAGVMDKFSSANQAVQDVETKYVGRLSVKDSVALQIAKKQLSGFNQSLKDSMLMAGLGGNYKEIMDRVEESKIEHEKNIRKAMMKRRATVKTLKELGEIFFIFSIVGGLAAGIAWIWFTFFKGG